MISRTPRLSLVVLVALALSACSTTGGVDEASSADGGTIELAVSETCAEGSDSECVSVNGENVLLPSTFEQAGVEDAAVVEGEEQNAVDVTFTEDGAVLLHSLTEEAAGASDGARLVMKVGDEVLAAVMVMEAMEGDQVQISLSPDASAQEVVDLIHQG